MQMQLTKINVPWEERKGLSHRHKWGVIGLKDGTILDLKYENCKQAQSILDSTQ